MRKLRTFLVWAVISVVLQGGLLGFINSKFKGNVADANQPAKPVIVQEKFNVPEGNLKNLQASFDKQYLAYTDDQGLKVFDVKTKKLAFQENDPPHGNVLSYKWLPDRNILLFIEEKPNSKSSSVTTVPTQSYTKLVPSTEDPHQMVKVTVTTPSHKVSHYYNPQITDLYSVDFGEGYYTQDTKPSERYERTIDGFPAGGTIQAMDFSTYTNLIYVPVKTTYGQILYEIDIMRKITELQRPGEKILRIDISDKKGTLYVQSEVNGINQIIDIKHHIRQQLFHGSQYALLGQDDGKVMIGIVTGHTLTEIFSIPDTGLEVKASLQRTVEWQGSLPWKDYNVVTGTGGFLVFYDNHGAKILDNGKIRSVKFTAQNNFITSDGHEIMEVTPMDNGTSNVILKTL